MISFDVKPESTSSSQGTKSSKSSDKESTLSFSELLKGANSKKDDKVVHNGTLVLALGSEAKDVKETKEVPKKESLLALLKNSDKELTEIKESLELNPKLTSSMSATELKSLISDAKEYLKSQILNSDDYKKSQTKELPKTLKGLAELAKNFGIDVSKITLEEVKAKTIDTKTELPLMKDTKTEVSHAKENGVKIEVPHAKDTKAETQISKATSENEKLLKSEDALIKETKATPLFKAQASSEHSTEQLVHTKASGQLKSEDKNQKNKADDTLAQLLRGEKPSQISGTQSADISVATVNAISRTSTSETVKSLEKLLHGEADTKSDGATLQKIDQKTDVITTHKADSFEVKLNEAKQMIRYLSADVKTAIEDYKSPFTRIKVQLNPEKLGDVELTIVQRGKNLHVNISSNATAINTLSTNVTELRTQLTNNGINNATLNFNSSSDSSGQNQQQGQKQQEKRAHEEYNYVENEEKNEEILSSLEIVVPRYI